MIIFTKPEVVQLKLTSAALYNSHTISAPTGVTVAKPHASSLSQPEKQKRNLRFPSISRAKFLLEIPLFTAIYLVFHISVRLKTHEFH